MELNCSFCHSRSSANDTTPFCELEIHVEKNGKFRKKIEAGKSTMLSSFLDCHEIGGNICNDNVDVNGIAADNNFCHKYEHDKPLFMPQSI